MQPTEKLKLELGQVIGNDYTYVTSKDETRHFTGLEVIEGYAVFLLLIFIKAAGVALKEHLENAVKIAGVKVGDLIWNAAKRAIGIAPLREGDTKQDAELQKVAPTLQELFREMNAKEREAFLAAGQLAVKKQMIKDGLPKEVAEEKAEQFIRVIKEQVD